MPVKDKNLAITSTKFSSKTPIEAQFYVDLSKFVQNLSAHF